MDLIYRFTSLTLMITKASAVRTQLTPMLFFPNDSIQQKNSGRGPKNKRAFAIEWVETK